MNPSKQVSVILLPNLAPPSIAVDWAAIVIDTLRFTTTAARAIESGASSIFAVQDIAAARELASRSGSKIKLCGERECRPIEGFDFGNSPLEYSPAAVSGLDLVFTTTNGTRAVESATQSSHCLLGALVNRTAVAKAVAASTVPVWQVICAGTDGQIAGEDMLTAGAIVEALTKLCQVTLSTDSARLALTLWQSVWSENSASLSGILEGFSGGNNLVQSGYQADIQYACQLDLLNSVPARAKPDLVFRRLEAGLGNG